MNSAPVDSTAPAYSRGARGYVVQNLQRALSINPDGDFGNITRGKVIDTQTALGYAPTGKADQFLFETLGLKWPGKFERCLNITDAFEGTGFGGINTTDIDGAGVTLGIVGFTTESGEVQRVVSEYIKIRPQALDKVPSPHREKLLSLTKASGKNREAWDRWFYGNDEVVDRWIRDVVAGWGEDPMFRRMQLAIVESEMWLPVLAVAKELGITTLAGLGLLFDIRVQNGGWARRHEAHYHVAADASESDKLKAVARAVAACASERWQEDVLTRKMVFAKGSGLVHGHDFELASFGF